MRGYDINIGLACGKDWISGVSNAQKRAATRVRNRDGFTEGHFLQWSLWMLGRWLTEKWDNSNPTRGTIESGK